MNKNYNFACHPLSARAFPRRMASAQSRMHQMHFGTRAFPSRLLPLDIPIQAIWSRFFPPLLSCCSPEKRTDVEHNVALTDKVPRPCARVRKSVIVKLPPLTPCTPSELLQQLLLFTELQVYSFMTFSSEMRWNPSEGSHCCCCCSRSQSNLECSNYILPP